VIGDIFQPTHLLLILAVALLVLGPKRLPEMARSLGRGFRDFKDAIGGDGHMSMHELDQQPVQPTTPPAAGTRASAQRPVAATASPADPMASPADSMASPPPDPGFVTEPEPVASQASDRPSEGTG
jgi:sec-independent protein translocase protein TatA